MNISYNFFSSIPPTKLEFKALKLEFDHILPLTYKMFHSYSVKHIIVQFDRQTGFTSS